jgi:hypothetical protein
VQDLQGDIACEFKVEGAEDGPHPAGSESRADFKVSNPDSCFFPRGNAVGGEQGVEQVFGW